MKGWWMPRFSIRTGLIISIILITAFATALTWHRRTVRQRVLVAQLESFEEEPFLCLVYYDDEVIWDEPTQSYKLPPISTEDLLELIQRPLFPKPTDSNWFPELGRDYFHSPRVVWFLHEVPPEAIPVIQNLSSVKQIDCDGDTNNLRQLFPDHIIADPLPRILE